MDIFPAYLPVVFADSEVTQRNAANLIAVKSAQLADLCVRQHAAGIAEQAGHCKG